MSNQGYELAMWLRAELRARKYPVPVVYAPERAERTKHDPVILVMRDRQTSEKVETAHGNDKNGRKFRTRRVPLAIKVYAKSALDGARIVEHEELADYLVDALITALETWATAERGGTIEYGEMAFMTSDELAADGDPEGWPGVVYLLKFTIGRGVVKRDYLKQVQPTGVLTGVSNSVEVRQIDDDGEPADPAVQPPEEDP